MIQISNQALSILPNDRLYLMHKTYEDTDVEGARLAESVHEFLERGAPGQFICFLANDSVTPPCCNAEGHYPCHFYDPYWYTYLLPASVWEQYQAAVLEADRVYKQSKTCKEQ